VVAVGESYVAECPARAGNDGLYLIVDRAQTVNPEEDTHAWA
jgi:hypothetical protein